MNLEHLPAADRALAIYKAFPGGNGERDLV